MIHLGNAPATRLQGNSSVRSLRSFVMAALTAAALSVAIAPAMAQTSNNGATRSETPDEKNVTPTGTPRRGRSAGQMRRGQRRNVVTPSRVILVFPTDTKGGASDQLADIITETVQGRIAAGGRYQTVYFLRSIPTVTRALNEATLTVNEVSHPFDDDIKLRKLMPYSGYDLALTTSVDSYSYDSAKNQVTLLISARLIDFRGEKPVVRAAAENGSSPENGGNAKELTLANQVGKSITEKLMTSLLMQDRSGQSPPAVPGK